LLNQLQRTAGSFSKGHPADHHSFNLLRNSSFRYQVYCSSPLHSTISLLKPNHAYALYFCKIYCTYSWVYSKFFSIQNFEVK